MTVIDICVGVQTPKLKVPLSFSPTRDDRGWITPILNGNPWWTILLAFIPALLGTILIFMDQQITAVIVNRKEFKLKVSKSGMVYTSKTITILAGFTIIKRNEMKVVS